MPNYWVHVLRQESTEALIIALSSFPLQDGSAVPTAKYDSWHHLHAALANVGIAASVLQDAENILGTDGFVTVTDIPLTHTQLEALGFVKLAEFLPA